MSKGLQNEEGGYEKQLKRLKSKHRMKKIMHQESIVKR